MHRDLQLSLRFQTEAQKQFLCSWVGNVSDIGSKMEHVSLHLWHKVCAVVTTDFFLTEGHKTNQMEQEVQYTESESRVNLCMSADNDRASSYILMLFWVRNDPFSGSGLRKGFLGHVFSRKSQPITCMYKYCMHVIFAKAKRMRLDLKAREYNAFRTMILQWVIGELSTWG